MSGDIFGCLSFLSFGGKRGVTGISWMEVKEAAKYPKVHRMPPQQGVIWPQVSLVGSGETLHH